MKIYTGALFLVVAGGLCFVGCESKERPAGPTPVDTEKPSSAVTPKPTATKTVTAAPDEAPKSTLKPEDVDPNKPVPVAELNAAVTPPGALDAWKGKELKIIGYYRGTTTSTTSSGKTVRIDLVDPETRKGAVGCNMKTEPTKEEKDDLAKKRDGVILKGKIKKLLFNDVLMEECTLEPR